MYNIIGDVHQLIGHFVISLGHCLWLDLSGNTLFLLTEIKNLQIPTPDSKGGPLVFLFLQPILWRGWKIVNLMEIFTQRFMIVQNLIYYRQLSIDVETKKYKIKTSFIKLSSGLTQQVLLALWYYSWKIVCNTMLNIIF